MKQTINFSAKGLKEFRAWETWTPARALDYLRWASNCHCKELGC